jgi:hypothetical protein
VPLAPRPIVDTDDARRCSGVSRADTALEVMEDSIVAGGQAEPREEAFGALPSCGVPQRKQKVDDARGAPERRCGKPGICSAKIR